MRFISDGPAIPDDLLIARDAGDVIFFCGAGVSQHKAKLPDFLKLGRDVIAQLGAGKKSLAAKLYKKVSEIGPMEGIGGLIATDRIFGLLEREFETKDVRAAVAKSIKPADDVDLGAHRLLLDLSRSRDGTVRLVTTNFDLLFEACDTELARSGPPYLPDPRSARFAGIVHLHGRVKDDYSGGADEEFVVSSADFGRAYLSDGWATRFMQALLARFQIVFVGYTADDPPVQYLLEALNLRAGSRSRLFAFQGGQSTDAQALWEQRGVRAIPFDNSKSYDPLWDTLAAWAERARDVNGWYERIFAAAAAGPVNVEPHVRGQIAHIFSTREGARRVSLADPPIPASWLLVLDPSLRYDKPGPIDPYDEASERIDPYECLALDVDTPPEPIDDDKYLGERKIPDGAWDAFASTRGDWEEWGEPPSAAVRGPAACASVVLGPRLASLGIWVQHVAHQPIALWWAAKRGPLHPTIVRSIEAWLRQDPQRWPDDVRRGWRLLFVAWSDVRDNPGQKFYDIGARIKLDGWTQSLVRDYVAIFRPQLKVERRLGNRHPLSWTEADRPSPLLSYDVDYPRPYDELEIPEELLNYAAGLFRSNLELARSLEEEISGNDHLHFETTRPDDSAPPIAHDSFGLTGPIAQFQDLMGRLVAVDLDLARGELARWPTEDRYVFARLRIWAAASKITSARQASAILLGLPDEVFWGSIHQRDLLYALRDRWPDFSPEDRGAFEDRLRTTSYPWSEDVRGGKVRVSAHSRLDRLRWLANQGVSFSFDVAAETAGLQALAPEWTASSANEAAESHAPVVRSIDTDRSPDVLLEVPLAEILDRAKEAGERDFFDFVERQPFRGLAEERPTRALGALTHAARLGDVPASAWAAFLYPDARRSDPLRMSKVIAARLANLPIEGLRSIAYPVSEWLVALGDRRYGDLARVLSLIWEPLIAALRLRSDDRKHAIDSSWANDALNAPVSKLVNVLMKDPTTKGLPPGATYPEHWKARLDQLLALPGDMRRHALVMIGFHTDGLYAIDPEWTERQLLSAAGADGPDGDAFWDGILWAARAPSRSLFERLKPSLQARALTPARRRAEANVIAGFLLIGWGGDVGADPPEQLVANDEFREILAESDDDLRGQVLWYLQRWSADAEGRWRDRVIPFFTRVWPNHRALRTPQMSARLADFAFNSGDLFPDVVGAILPRLVPVRGAVLQTLLLDGMAKAHPARCFPAATLDLLWVILAEDPALWPYKIETMLDLLNNAPETAADPRLSELRRRRAL